MSGSGPVAPVVTPVVTPVGARNPLGGRRTAADRRRGGPGTGGRHRVRTSRHDDHGRRRDQLRYGRRRARRARSGGALDPRSRAATIGGILACGLSGVRRLRHGPVHDHVLEVRFETGDGRW